MPRVKSVKSLFQLCIAFIVPIIEDSDFPVKPSTNNEVAMIEPEVVVNPFHQLPVSVLEQIIVNVNFVYHTYGKPANTFVLEYLISLQLRFARFHYFTEEYLTVFPQFGNLLSLNLRFTKAGDDCLHLIGTYCTNLRMLDVHQCHRITDTGVRLLCFNYDDLIDKPSGLCKSLQYLLMYCTSVTKQGVQLAINNLTKLKSLHHLSTFEVLVEFIQKNRSDQNWSELPNLFSLVDLRVGYVTPYRQGSLGQVVQLISSLTSVIIIAMKELTDTDLLSLTSLKNLRQFYLNCPTELKQYKGFEITFKGSVVPLLKNTGNLLEVLDICFFAVVDLWTVFKLCPNLNSLFFKTHCESVTALSESEIILYRNEKERFILKNLETLYCGYTISSEILHFLLSFPTLIDIHIVCCRALTDEFLQNAVSCFKFKNVKRFHLTLCYHITKRGIDTLMTNGNLVEEIDIKFCRNLTHGNAYEWHLQAKKENWKLNLRYKNSDVEISYRTY